MIYKRYINLPKLLAKKSVMLIGPRQTGKSTLARESLKNALYINLAASDTFRELTANPELLRQRLAAANTSELIIDEAQRIPEIFNEIQLLLDADKKLRVLLTGSSARKLKRNEINLLPGRIWKEDLYPLVFSELGKGRVLDRVRKGSMPGIIDSADYKEELKNYVGLYLEEEVRAEGLVRGIGDFSRFLSVAALYNTNQVNFSNIASDTGIKVNTVRSYFQILEDTLIDFQLPTFRKTKSRKAIATPKFYFFDIGIVNALLSRFDISPGNELFGSAFEHLVFMELKAFLSYNKRDEELTYWRTHSKLEVDFIIGDSVAIEIKSSGMVSGRDEKGLQALSEDIKLKRKIIVCMESAPRKSDSGIEILPLEDFLEKLWSGEII